MYMSCFVSPLVECRAGTSVFGHCGGGTAGLYGFSSLWLCSGGYRSGEMVRGGGECVVLLFSSVCCQFSWRLDICGRDFCVTIFVGSM